MGRTHLSPRARAGGAGGRLDYHCGRTAALWVYQLEVTDLMKARTQVEEAMDGVGAEPLRPGCSAYGGWAHGVGDETLWVTRWVPRSAVRDLDSKVLSVGKLLASGEAGMVGDNPEGSVARLAALREKLRAMQESRMSDAFELRNLRGEIEDLTPKAEAVQATLGKELTHVLLILPERLRKAFDPPLRSFTIKPAHSVVTRPHLGADEIRRSMRWSKKRDSADNTPHRDGEEAQKVLQRRR